MALFNPYSIDKRTAPPHLGRQGGVRMIRYGVILLIPNSGYHLKLQDEKNTSPNPCTNEVKLTSDGQFESYTITDLSGKLVGRNSISDNKIDLSFAAKGIYLLSVKDKSGRSRVGKIVKE